MGEAASPRPEPYDWMRDVFLRLLGAVYLVAFLSFWVQAEGLIGTHGILPIRDLLLLARERLGPSRYWVLPTVFWLGDGDLALHVVCVSGAVLAVLTLLGRARPLVMLGRWGLYLSLTVAGEDVLSFQWDVLLLEAGLLAVPLAPRGLLRLRPGPPPLLVVWMYRWLLFRLMFGSGVVKLRSGDAAWRSLTALQYHYETQPLPTWIGFYAHHLSTRFQAASVAVMFLIELVLPWLIWFPGRWRRVPLAAFVAFQMLIAATGNYAFFNLLTVALCVFLADPALLPRRWRPAAPAAPATLFGAWPRSLLAPLLAVLASVSVVQFSEATLGLGVPWPSPVVWLARAVSPLRSVNSYGLFAVMTTTRPEIVVEGSDDGETWRAYEFRYKPGDLQRRPGFVAPHQPRLDWQMWFAALGGSCDESPWLQRFFERLREGSPAVVGLLGRNPFPDRPPRYVRAVLYDYRFVDLATHRRTGEWWQRGPETAFCGP